MAYLAIIKNNKTGIYKAIKQNLDLHEHSDYWWQDGNMACDCNRSLEYYIKSEKKGDIECSNYLFSVPCLIAEDGRVVEIDGIEY